MLKVSELASFLYVTTYNTNYSSSLDTYPDSLEITVNFTKLWMNSFYRFMAENESGRETDSTKFVHKVRIMCVRASAGKNGKEEGRRRRKLV
jgi:hypothetical protein